MCVFSVSMRRRSWILGQAVSLWAGVLCNHTHKHSEDSHQQSRAEVQRRGTCPLTNTHTHTLFPPHCLRVPPCQGLILVEQQGRRCCHCQGQPVILQIRETGPQLISLSHCAHVLSQVTLPSDLISRAPPDTSVPHFLGLDLKQAVMTTL